MLLIFRHNQYTAALSCPSLLMAHQNPDDNSSIRRVTGTPNHPLYSFLVSARLGQEMGRGLALMEVLLYAQLCDPIM